MIPEHSRQKRIFISNNSIHYSAMKCRKKCGEWLVDRIIFFRITLELFDLFLEWNGNSVAWPLPCRAMSFALNDLYKHVRPNLLFILGWPLCECCCCNKILISVGYISTIVGNSITIRQITMLSKLSKGCSIEWYIVFHSAACYIIVLLLSCIYM